MKKIMMLISFVLFCSHNLYSMREFLLDKEKSLKEKYLERQISLLEEIREMETGKNAEELISEFAIKINDIAKGTSSRIKRADEILDILAKNTKNLDLGEYSLNGHMHSLFKIIYEKLPKRTQRLKFFGDAIFRSYNDLSSPKKENFIKLIKEVSDLIKNILLAVKDLTEQTNILQAFYGIKYDESKTLEFNFYLPCKECFRLRRPCFEHLPKITPKEIIHGNIIEELEKKMDSALRDMPKPRIFESKTRKILRENVLRAHKKFIDDLEAYRKEFLRED